MNRHLIDIEDLDRAELGALIDRAVALDGGAAVLPRDGTVANLFFEPSTRTRVSFQIAARRLGLDVVNIDHSNSSTSKGESLADTARTLAAMGVKAIVLRHPDDDAPGALAESLADCPVHIVNAGAGQRAHPSQALLDAATLQLAGLRPDALKLAILGDVAHSRVARSDIAVFQRLGAAEIRVAGPHEFMPTDDALPGVVRCASIDEALEGIDAVICLRIQRERIDRTGYLDGEAFHRQWGLTRERLAGMPGHARILHPGPVNRDVELAGELVDHPRSLILDQVRVGVHLRTALFERLIDAH